MLTNQPNPSSPFKQSVRIGLLCDVRDEEALDPVVDAIHELTLSDRRREHFWYATRSKEYAAAARQMTGVIFEKMDQQLRKNVEEAIASDPHDRNIARIFRARLDASPKEHRHLWGAYMFMAERCHLIKHDHDEFSSLCRGAWADAGCQMHPIALNLPCINCGALAEHEIIAVPSKSRSIFKSACAQCGLSENWVQDFRERKSSYPGSEESARYWAAGNQCSNSRLSLNSEDRQKHLKALQDFANSVKTRFQLIADNNVREGLSEFKNPAHRAWNTAPSNFVNFKIHSGSSAIYASEAESGIFEAPPEDSFRYGALYSAIDNAFGHLTSLEMSMNEVELKVNHPAAHWQEEFDSHLKGLKQSLATDDAVEAVVHALMLVSGIRRNGVLSRIGLDCTLPGVIALPNGSDRLLGADVPSVCVPSALPSCDINELATRVAEGLAGHSLGERSVTAVRDLLIAYAAELRQRSQGPIQEVAP